MHEGSLVPFFQGSLDQVRELTELCRDHGLPATPVRPPGGGGS